jgi:hypothetical protein
VLISASGERGSASNELNQEHLRTFGQATVRSILTLDKTPSFTQQARDDIVLERKVVSSDTVRLLLSALLFPIIVTLFDALARMRRRRQPIAKWFGWVLCGSLPFLAALAIALVSVFTGLLAATPATAVSGDVVPLRAGGIITLLAVFVTLVLGWLLFRRFALRVFNLVSDPAAGGASFAALFVLSCLAVVSLITNPFTVLLIVVSLHFWLIMAAAPSQLSRIWTVLALLASILPLALVVAFFAKQFNLDLLGMPWAGVLIASGKVVSVPVMVGWSVALGCICSLVACGFARARLDGDEPHVTVRGPVTYAGPGSLGGT